MIEDFLIVPSEALSKPIRTFANGDVVLERAPDGLRQTIIKLDNGVVTMQRFPILRPDQFRYGHILMEPINGEPGSISIIRPNPRISFYIFGKGKMVYGSGEGRHIDLVLAQFLGIEDQELEEVALDSVIDPDVSRAVQAPFALAA